MAYIFVSLLMERLYEISVSSFVILSVNELSIERAFPQRCTKTRPKRRKFHIES